MGRKPTAVGGSRPESLVGSFRRVGFQLSFIEQNRLWDDPCYMSIASISALKDVTQRFDAAVGRVLAAAQNLSDPASGGGDLAGASVDMLVSQRSVQAASAAVRASHEGNSSILDIVA